MIIACSALDDVEHGVVELCGVGSVHGPFISCDQSGFRARGFTGTMGEMGRTADLVELHLELATIDRLPTRLEESSHMGVLVDAIRAASLVQCALRHGWNGSQFSGPFDTRELRKDINAHRMFLVIHHS